MQRWTVGAVEDAAPDVQVRQAGRRLAIPTPWSDVGATDTLLFGRCRGSGQVPYEVAIDLVGRRYRCSCPSRKSPCKHCVGLLYLWVEGRVDETGVAAGYAAAWAARQTGEPPRSSPRTDAAPTPEQLAAAQKRAAERESRVDGGLADLERFLVDLVGRGLAADPQRSRRFVEQSTRLVDAQAPGLAGRVRDLALITDATPRWTEQLTEQLGMAHLLVRAWQNRASLPADLVATVRAHVGFSTRADDVLATPGVTDSWVVTGQRDAEEDRVSVRRVWLWGSGTRRPALVLFFAAGGAPLASALYPGTCLQATLHFYPGRAPLRAAISARADHAQPVGAWRPPSQTVSEARRTWQDALAADPWLGQWPVILAGRLTVSPAGDIGLKDLAGDTVAVRGGKRWHAAALTGGGECQLLGELSRDGLLPSAVVVGERLVIL